ncbi:MAG TPA: beta-galactosidase, partial [Planctomycetaceae bacterium]|nr:beta-galactosidase [Planctomycetaceae bacterium]
MTRKLTRRQAIQTAAAASVATGMLSVARSAPAGPDAAAQDKRWFRHAYRRAVIDMHIPDWDPKFLSQFDPDEYAKMLVRSKSQSIVCYCQSHVGLFNFPTKIGKEHAAFQGRNMLQQMIDRCHAEKINVQLYTSLIFDRWCADQHPEWRIRTVDGRIQGEGGRFGVLCVNSPYREYVRSFVQEICQTFDFEGIRFDMTFWPSVCYCHFCQDRYAAEVGGKLPEIVNWLDARWVAFQRARERWLVEFAAVATSTVRKYKPQATV